MNVEQLIEKLKKMPPLYELRAHIDGIEIPDIDALLADMSLMPNTKIVLLELEQI